MVLRALYQKPGAETNIYFFCYFTLPFCFSYMDEEQRQGLAPQPLANLLPTFHAQTSLLFWLLFQLLIPTLPLTSCVTLYKTLSYIGYQFPFL